MATKKHPLPVYLDETEFYMLRRIASESFLSLSGAMKYLIRERYVEDDKERLAVMRRMQMRNTLARFEELDDEQNAIITKEINEL